MTQEKLNEANKIADMMAATDSVLRRLDTSVNTDLLTIVNAVGKKRLVTYLNDYKKTLINKFSQL